MSLTLHPLAGRIERIMPERIQIMYLGFGALEYNIGMMIAGLLK